MPRSLALAKFKAQFINAKAEVSKMVVLSKYSDLPSDLDDLSKRVVDSVFCVHKNLGAGYLEKVYEVCLCIELDKRQIKYERQKKLPIMYEGRLIETDFRLDLVIEDKIILELKAVDVIHPVFEAQIYSYLKMSGLQLGFLINFNVPLIKQGIRRYVAK